MPSQNKIETATVEQRLPTIVSNRTLFATEREKKCCCCSVRNERIKIRRGDGANRGKNLTFHKPRKKEHFANRGENRTSQTNVENPFKPLTTTFIFSLALSFRHLRTVRERLAVFPTPTSRRANNLCNNNNDDLGDGK